MKKIFLFRIFFTFSFAQFLFFGCAPIKKPGQEGENTDESGEAGDGQSGGNNLFGMLGNVTGQVNKAKDQFGEVKGPVQKITDKQTSYFYKRGNFVNSYFQVSFDDGQFESSSEDNKNINITYSITIYPNSSTRTSKATINNISVMCGMGLTNVEAINSTNKGGNNLSESLLDDMKGNKKQFSASLTLSGYKKGKNIYCWLEDSTAPKGTN